MITEIKVTPSYTEMRDILRSYYYVYILLDTKTHRLYIGSTSELQPRLIEHKFGITLSTASMTPKLIYFETQPTKELSIEREKELKFMLRKNRRQVFRLINEFQNIIKDITPLSLILEE
jgi:putative endonuclease